VPLPEVGASASAEKTWRHELTIIIPHVLSCPAARDTIIARDKMAIIMSDESEIKQVSPLTLVQYLPMGRQALGTHTEAERRTHDGALRHIKSLPIRVPIAISRREHRRKRHSPLTRHSSHPLSCLADNKRRITSHGQISNSSPLIITPVSTYQRLPKSSK
jgi:hypothetical protein